MERTCQQCSIHIIRNDQNPTKDQKINTIPSSKEISRDANTITKYEEGTSKLFAKAAIMNEEGYCVMGDGQQLTIGGNFDLYALLAEKAPQTMNVPFEYFIAVLDNKNNVLSRKSYIRNIKFRRNKSSKREKVKFEEILTLNTMENLQEYNILLSFQLSKKELQENRETNNPY